MRTNTGVYGRGTFQYLKNQANSGIYPKEQKQTKNAMNKVGLHFE